ncbi:MAG: polyribonucleotide nucleotidyltransferase [Rhodospirillales bacterium]|jgi:polyribonucleotide nucleotidyltransferase|nr:polyribonucleotide nucleotidyltransferase [Rhodospirillales bacterium]
MFKEFRKEIQWGGRALTLESGKIARQADGAVLVTYGETKVLCTVVYEKAPKPGLDFFPLSVHYQEKTFAAGKIPGGFFKREGRPAEKEVLSSRLIDRPIRPLFAKGYRNETQIICTVLSHDLENDPDIVAMIGSSAALTLSGVPFLGPIAGCRVGYIAGEYVLNPQLDELPASALDLVVAGTREGVLMVESEAKELSEEVMLGAVMFGHRAMQPVVDAIVELAEACAREPIDVPTPPAGLADLSERLRASGEGDLRTAYGESGKAMRREKVAALKLQLSDALSADESLDAEVVFDGFEDAFKSLEKDVVRKSILSEKQRIDGRGPADIRPIAVEVGLLPRAHGSALFTRGETQALVVTTLGTGQDEQIIDALAGEFREHFLLHYNFPPYSVGEAGRFGFTGRREIGHGKLAWRSVHPLLPAKDTFPYTIRVVSEITESNGSSSMATVCGASLSMMDAGVPLTRPVAGIAMGLIKEGDDFVVLSDILGDEDHLGDMDFKVAGSSEGITALQMDIKITSITEEIMRVALAQARDGRHHILNEMAIGISSARETLNQNAPRITVIHINKDKIREVIGPGGKIIREICEVTGARIDLEDDGTVKVAAVDQRSADAAIDWIRSIAAEPEVGLIYTGKVVKTVDFGAFVNFLGSRDGLVHISEMARERVNKVTDVVQVGDMVKVKLIGVDDRGKFKLSMRAVDQESGEDVSQAKAAS